jgi:hypothetical protein
MPASMMRPATGPSLQRRQVTILLRHERVEITRPADLDRGAHPRRELPELRALRRRRERAFQPRDHRVGRSLRDRDSSPERQREVDAAFLERRHVRQGAEALLAGDGEDADLLARDLRHDLGGQLHAPLDLVPSTVVTASC